MGFSAGPTRAEGPRGPRADGKSRTLTALHDCHTLYDMTTKRTTKVLTVSLPPDAAEDFDRLAAREGRNRSELFREMFVVYRAYLETRTFEIGRAHV